MSGSVLSRRILGYYEYFMPGIYDYPVTHSSAATISAYQLDSELDSGSSLWSIPDASANYVVGPLGVINYLSDVQTHLALPTIQNLETGLIFTTISSISQDSYYHQSLYDYGQVEDDLTDDEGYGYEIPQLDLGSERPTSESDGVEQEQVEESGDSQRSSKSYSSEESGSAEPVQTDEEVPRKRRKVSRKRIYKAEQGYLVEEPTSELSEDDTAEQPSIPRT
ncbi:uncharacterized protein LOC119560905 [Drosophila subpulchrella]|uniref:uncharacterized protein LOC119560905 n=1 Tax=Drosophila subpulchrella TaxID=1486046 RepID=UPI0018A182D7|nr:uncharacterized protein LOC119560905 [Drosophila subpulchrella]